MTLRNSKKTDNIKQIDAKRGIILCREINAAFVSQRIDPIRTDHIRNESFLKKRLIDACITVPLVNLTGRHSVHSGSVFPK